MEQARRAQPTGDESSAWSWAPRFAALASGSLLGIVAAGMLWRLCSIWAARVRHPFDLEWMEGGMLIHAWRMQRGLPIYVEPNLDFIPFVYPPGYPAILVALSEFFALDYPLGRAISVTSTALAAAAIVFVVRRSTRAWQPALVGALVYLGSYPSSGLFYDLVRSDALAMALLAWAIALAFVRSPAARLGSALLLAGAATVKLQTAAFGLPLLWFVFARDGAVPALRYVLASALPALAFAALMQWRTDGSFLQWVIAAPASHGMVWPRFFPGTPAELGRHLPIAMLALAGCVSWLVASELGGERRRRFGAATAVLAIAGALCALALPERIPVSRFEGVIGLASSAVLGMVGAVWLRIHGSPGGARHEGVFWIGLGAMALFSCAMARGHVGGYVNVLMSLHWVLAAGFGVALSRIAARRHAGAVLASALAAAQIALQWNALDTRGMAPTEDDRVAGERLVDDLRQRPGPILSPFAPWLAVQAGHDPSLHLLSITENAHRGSAFPSTRMRIEEAVEAAHWPTVVAGNRRIGFGIEERYEFSRFLETAGRQLWSRSGYRVRPEAIMIPRP